MKAGRAYDIQAIRPTQHRGTRSSCSVDQNGWEQYLETTAVETDMEFLGTIHTHIDELHYPEPSHRDNLDAIECGERIFAIDCIKTLPSGRKKHTVKFWFPQAPVENITLV